MDVHAAYCLGMGYKYCMLYGQRPIVVFQVRVKDVYRYDRLLLVSRIATDMHKVLYCTDTPCHQRGLTTDSGTLRHA